MRLRILPVLPSSARKKEYTIKSWLEIMYTAFADYFKRIENTFSELCRKIGKKNDWCVDWLWDCYLNVHNITYTL